MDQRFRCLRSPAGSEHNSEAAAVFQRLTFYPKTGRGGEETPLCFSLLDTYLGNRASEALPLGLTWISRDHSPKSGRNSAGAAHLEWRSPRSSAAEAWRRTGGGGGGEWQ